MVSSTSSSIGFFNHSGHFEFNDFILSFGNGFKSMVLANENGGFFETWVVKRCIAVLMRLNFISQTTISRNEKVDECHETHVVA